MLFLVGKFKEIDGERYMVLDEAIKYTKAELKEAIAHADAIGHAYVAMLKEGLIPILIYDTDTEG